MRSSFHKPNYYKIGFFVFLGLILLSLLFLGGTYFANTQYERGVVDGQVSAIQVMYNNIASNGYVTLTIDNQNLTLVPAESVGLAQENVITAILESVQTRGYVTIYNNQSQVVLVPQEETR